jgi:serine/threonine-protein kinase
MAYYDGPTLKKKLEAGPLQIDESVKIAYQIADGLQRAHEAGVIHRDVKPANIIITERGQAKIVDFGIAKLADETKFRSPADTGGTAAYMSPEQAQGSEADHRSDLFSLGILLYEMVTGRRPFLGEHEAAILYSVVNTDPPKPSFHRGDVPATLDSIILRLLEKDPGRRYQNAAELQNDLGQLLGLAPRRVLTRPSAWNRMLRIVLPIVGIAAIIALVPEARDWVASQVRRAFIPEGRTVVVLPFSTLTRDSLSRDLGAGLTSTLTSTLSQVERYGHRLGIVPASSVREARIRTAEEARSKFAATLVVTGEIQLIDQNLRVTVNVIDAVRLNQIGSDVVDYPVSDLAYIQDQTSDRLASLLEIDLIDPLRAAIAEAGTQSSDAFRYYSQGRVYLARHEQVANINLAIGLFERALGADSTYGLAYAGLGEAYWRKYRRTKDVQWTEPARRACSQALELVPDLSETRVTLGMIYQGTGEYSLALEEHRRAFALNNGNVDALIGLGNAYESLGETARADSSYRRAIAQAPGYWDAYNNLGYFLLFQGDVKSAAAQFRIVTELAPDNIIGYNNLGGALLYQNRWMEAKEVFEQSLAIAPSSAAISNLGTIYFYQEAKYEKAAEVYERGVQLNPKDYRLWANLGAAYYQITGKRSESWKRYQKAIDFATEDLRVNPNDPVVLANLGRFNAILGERELAFEYLGRVQSAEEGSPGVFLIVAETYEHLSMRQEALQWVEEGYQKGVSLELFERSPQMADLIADPSYGTIKSRPQSVPH